MKRYEFELQGHYDTPEKIADHVNELTGQSFLTAVRSALTAKGYHCSETDFEDWGWYFCTADHGRQFLVGCETYGNQDTREAHLFIKQERSLFDRLLRRNPAATEPGIEAGLRQVLVEMHGVTGLRESSG
ncbi:hypothetical protein [Leisingera sp. McT4-56]|uniref:hypothetical protein n=1 Tax=Leisingera sp. McT4-56 TaxID=2881255 RepID=UPI001CF8CBA3|nr:hypothetical protein [Leisingera sp. McT4-56]MCB4456238.1 hypothetical protein [Leisingera sp. McT4-56]